MINKQNTEIIFNFISFLAPLNAHVLEHTLFHLFMLMSFAYEYNYEERRTKVKNNFWWSDLQGVVVADLTEGD